MVKMFYKGNEILHVKNSTFEIFYNNILAIIERENIQLNENLNNLIDKLYVGADGVGTEFAKFIKNKKDMDFFLKLAHEALTMFEEEFVDKAEEAKKSLHNFYNELVKYGEELE